MADYWVGLDTGGAIQVTEEHLRDHESAAC